MDVNQFNDYSRLFDISNYLRFLRWVISEYKTKILVKFWIRLLFTSKVIRLDGNIHNYSKLLYDKFRCWTLRFWM